MAVICAIDAVDSLKSISQSLMVVVLLVLLLQLALLLIKFVLSQYIWFDLIRCRTETIMQMTRITTNTNTPNIVSTVSMWLCVILLAAAAALVDDDIFDGLAVSRDAVTVPCTPFPISMSFLSSTIFLAIPSLLFILVWCASYKDFVVIW